MSKLFKLREWLTIAEAAKHLSVILDEPVNEADVYRLGLDGHLILSINLIKQLRAYRGVPVPFLEAKKTPAYSFPPTKSSPEIVLGVSYDNDKIIQFNNDGIGGNPLLITGIFDLPMFGAVRMHCEEKFQTLTGGATLNVTFVNLDGVIVKSTKKEEFYSIVDEIEVQKLTKSTKFEFTPKTYLPVQRLPIDSTLIVRTPELTKFKVSLQNKSQKLLQEKPLGARERNTLLKIIGGLAMDGYGMDIHAKRLDQLAEIVGVLAGVGVEIDDDTLRKHLKAAAELIPKPN